MVNIRAELVAMIHESRNYYVSLGWHKCDCDIGSHPLENHIRLASDNGSQVGRRDWLHHSRGPRPVQQAY